TSSCLSLERIPPAPHSGSRLYIRDNGRAIRPVPEEIHMSRVAVRVHVRFRRWLEATLVCAVAATGSSAPAQGGLRFSEAWFPEDCGLLKLRVKEPAAVCGFVLVRFCLWDAQSPRYLLPVARL